MYLKHLMAVIVEMKDAKNAAAVVKEVTHMVSKEWLRAKWTMLSSCSSRDSKLGSNLLWARQALTKMKVSSAPTPAKHIKDLKTTPHEFFKTYQWL